MYDHTTGIYCLVDNDAQISLIPATSGYILKGLMNILFRLSTSRLSRVRVISASHWPKKRFYSFFIIADLEKAILGADFMHKYSLFFINRRCLIDHEINVKLPGSINSANPLYLAVKNTEDDPEFCELVKRLEVITRQSFYRETLLHSLTPHIATSAPPAHSWSRWLALETLEFSQMLDLGIIRPSKGSFSIESFTKGSGNMGALVVVIGY